MTNEQQRPRDHESDPAHTPGDGWAEEGGASHLGPATHIESGHAPHETATEGVPAEGGESGVEEPV